MRLTTLLLLVVLIVFVALNISVEGRGRGSSPGSNRGTTRRSSSKPKSSNKGASNAKPKITKYTHIKATTVRSPVIVKQTEIGSRSNTLLKVFVGYVAINYVLSNAPVYRKGYPMYGSYLTIPEKRAIRISYEEQKLLDAEGMLCLRNKSSANVTLREGIDKNLVELNTTVEYKGSGRKQTFHGTEISLEDINEKDFEVTSRARYNTTVVEGSSCTQIQKTVNGTMVTMYETNPNKSSMICVDNGLFSTVIAMAAIIQILRFLQ